MIEILLTYVLPIFLAFVLPVILIPLIMRIFISRIVLFFVKRKYLPGSLKEIHKGWKTEQDNEAINAVSALAMERLKYHFVSKFQITDDIKAVLLCIQNVYSDKEDTDKLSFSFSIKKMIHCFLLGFCDLYKEFGSKKWFKYVKSLRLVWIGRISALSKKYKQVFDIPFIHKLKSTRLLGKIFRILLIPFIGIPALLWYAIRTVIVTIFLEGFIRFLYGLMLLKIGYYAIYLYGRNNPVINKRIDGISKEKLKQISKSIEDMILPEKWKTKSPYYEDASELYTELLMEFGMHKDEKFHGESSGISEKTKKILSRIITSAKRAYKGHNPFSKDTPTDKDRLQKMFYVLGKAYYSKSERPFLMYRFREAMELGYMACIILLSALYKTPGASTILDKISLDFVLKIKDISKMEIVKNSAGKMKTSYKYIKLFGKARKVYKVARGIVAPYSLIFSLGSPVLFQQLQDLLREFVYFRAGRLYIYGLEKNKLKKKDELHPLLW